MGPKNKKGGKKKKAADEIMIHEEFKTMSGEQLKQALQGLKEKVKTMKTKRNYIQMDRDMVEQFYHNTLQEIDEVKTSRLNKETEAEQLEDTHRVEQKVYSQKIKHIEYEQEKSNKEVQEDGERAKGKEIDYFQERIKSMKAEKMDHKKSFVENEKDQIKNVQEIEKQNEQLITYKKNQFKDKLEALVEKYEARLKQLKEDLELRQRVEIHELEERKNQHINELMTNHSTAFAELKKYYNDITAENLNLIKGQKQEINSINAKIQQNNKYLARLKEDNARLKGPLEHARAQRDELKNLVKNFSKHQMSLMNLKSKLITLRDKIRKLQDNSDELNSKYDVVVKEKKDLEEKFEKITQEVKKNSRLSNVVLKDRLESLQKKYENKDFQLRSVLEQANLDPIIYQNIVTKIQTSIEQKNTLIKNLKYSIHHATKAYNDAIRVYEAKLVEFGIPAEELGFQPLETITSTMPAGLVSS